MDSSNAIGSGHVMRCLTLADALLEKGCTCQFVCRNHPGNLSALIQEKGYRVTLLPLQEFQVEPYPHHASWLGGSWQDDAEQTIAAIGPNKPSWLIVDHYGIDSRWEKFLRPHVEKIMVIDDLADREHDCDLLLDQNHVGVINRYKKLVPQSCTKFLGPKFALLQPEYAQIRSIVKPKGGIVNNILIYYGGADIDDVTGKSLDAIRKIKDAHFDLDIVVGDSYCHFEGLEKRLKLFPNARIHQNIPSLAPLMLRADLSLGACGATAWERCCLGLPSVVVTLAKNQEFNSRWLARKKLVKLAKPEVQSLEKILKKIVQNGEIWIKKASLESMTVTDGLGLQRILGNLDRGNDIGLKARPADFKDIFLLFRWVNESQVRKNSFNSNKIDFQTHKSWFIKKINCRSKTKIFIIEDFSGKPIGQVRFDLNGDSWIIDFSLDKKMRGKKLGNRVLIVAINELSKIVKNAELIAKVKKNNPASAYILRSIGFSQIEDLDCFVFSKKLNDNDCII